ncbi:MAG TPA: hypothetical protein VNB06_10230 [Thermoanaerobaculia bacterium]|nr:hypothetical protein [Thermoanaerobaculia bacterium]
MSRIPGLQRIVVAALVLPALAAAPALAASSSTTEAKDQGSVTFYEDVLPILQGSCQTCHRPNGANLGGMVAPMAFTSYDETRPWAKSIAQKVAAREMPPWHASPAQAGVFENERTLTDAEIATIVSWTKAGAPAGDAGKAPLPRQWPNVEGWQIGEPDLVLSIPEKYLVGDEIEDHYITFETEITTDVLPEPRWARAIEFRPGSSVVHHIIALPLGGVAPGNDPTIHREGYGTLIKPGQVIRWQMHYHKEAGPGTAVWDLSQVALRFYPEGYQPTHVVQNAPLGNMWFEIPAGDPNYSSQVSYTLERDSRIVSLLPHAHVRGKGATYVAHYPDGTRETLLEVPEYDFNWQTTYRFREEKLVPAGTRIELVMSWDNSADNPNNPNPNEIVTFGQPTTSEMMFGFMDFTDAEPGYLPKERMGFGARSQTADMDPREALRSFLGIDLESLNPADRQRLIKSFMNNRRPGQGEEPGASSGRE